MTNEEIIKFIEDNVNDVHSHIKGKMYFCRANDGRYAIAMLNIVDKTVKYHFFDFNEIMPFYKEIGAILEEDEKKKRN